MKVSVAGRRFDFPRMCACCGGYADTSIPVSGSELNKRSRTRGWVWDVPYCRPCKQHVRLNDGILLGTLIVGAVGILIGAAIAVFKRDWRLGLETSVSALVGLAVVCLAVLRSIRQRASRHCVSMRLAMTYLGSNGPCHSFDIQSWYYANDFVLANRSKIVNANAKVASILRVNRPEHQMARRLLKRTR